MKNLKEESFLNEDNIWGHPFISRFEGDNIYYEILSVDHLTCEVTLVESEKSGAVVIPGAVLINNETYKVTAIRSKAFSGCRGLTSVTIPNSVTEIGDGAFSDCRSLRSIIIGNGVTKIGDGAFSGCRGLTSVTIPDSVTEIGDGAFSDCRSLRSIIIGNGVTEIGDGAFWRCSYLKEIRIEEGKKEIFLYSKDSKSPFIDCPLEYVYLGRNSRCEVENNGNIENYGSPFFGIKSIKELIIGDSVTIIGDRAFYECGGLTSVTIGKNVTKIEDKAFYCCDDLIEVNSLNPVPPRIRRETFSNYDNAILNVPKGSLNDYKDISYWKNFCRIQEKDFGGVETASNDVAKVFANGTRITIVGADKDAVVEVFDENGKRVTRGVGNEFEVEKNGIYTVHIDSKTSD